MPPTMLIDALHGIRRRVKLLGVMYGVGIAVAVAIALLLGTILFDYLFNLPAWPRLVLSILALCAVGYVIARWIWTPARAKLSLSDVAGRLERAFPQFDDRLRSTVNFATSGHAFGSDVMRDRVMSEAGELASRLDLNRAIVAKPVWHTTTVAGVAIVIALLIAMLTSPLYRNTAIARLFSPFNGPAWPKRVSIEMIGNVPQRVPVGQRFDLKMHLLKGDRASTKAKIFYQLDDGPVQQEYMTRAADGTYAVSLDAKSDPTRSASIMKVFITAGDDRVDLKPITVLPRLAIARVEAVVTPPKYVGEVVKPMTFNLAEGPALSASGSEVALRVAFNKTLAEGTPVEIKPLAEKAQVPTIQWTRSADRTLIGTWPASESMRFHVVATDTDGFENAGLEEYEVIVRPDQNPTVQIENPRRNEERTPVAVVPLQAVAEDDYGVSAMKLVVDRLGDKEKGHWEIDLVKGAKPVDGVSWNPIESSGERLRFRSHYTWDLAKLDPEGLKPGDVLEYHLQVTDNFALNNQSHAPVPSGKLRITIVSQEQFTDLITNELRNAVGAIRDVHVRQGRTKEETTDLAKETEKKPAFDAGDKAVAERLGNQQGTAASQSKQVAQKLEAIQARMEENKSPANDLKQIAGDVKDVLNNVAENPMKDVAAKLALAPQQNDPPKRGETLKSAETDQQAALDKLQGALDRMGSVGSLQQTIDKIRDLLKEQQRISKETAEIGAKNLGKKPEQMSNEDRAKLDKAASDQEKLAAKTDKAIADMLKQSEQLKKSDPASAEAMKQSAQTGQSQQVSPNQSRAAKAAKQNQQSQAQTAQKQAELGLQMMLNNLREAERRKMEELAKKLAEIQQQIAILIRRQAGHNLDNLGLQDKTVDKLEAKLAEELLALAERVKTALPPQPKLPQVTTSQEQTERNTRDIAQTVEQLPNGAEPASNLTRAASRMERAIVSLREKDLAGAYEPPQVEALAALLDAKKIIDEQKNQVDQKRDEQNKEAVRQVYMKIKAEQEKINAETTRIDKAPKGDDGNLKREDSIRLGQLPDEQKKIAVKTNELEEALAAVNSVVYIWANKDIVESMNQVRDDLAKPTTGVPTQAEQARIVEQLDSMIKNLEVRLLDRKFEQRGGGGGGQCGPKLPTEAELRLLKDLQKAVNTSTKRIDAEPDKDKPKLMALGGRQGELRNLLGEMLEKSSNGEAKLRPEPDNKDQLPEEAGADKVEQQELQQALASDEPDAEQIARDMMMVGDRMARSKQRLSLNNDPGKTTQLIQERILKDLDSLIEQSRKQACAGGSPQPGQGKGQNMAQAKAGQQVAEIQGNGKPGKSAKGSSPAAQSTAPGQTPTQTDVSEQIKESASEWGRISPRTRNAVIEGSSEQVIEKYRKYVEEYYKGVAVKGSERQ